ncbi:hypothetical protein LINGRAHAP2_LOCUS31104 [Linum grandiflorum]
MHRKPRHPARKRPPPPPPPPSELSPDLCSSTSFLITPNSSIASITSFLSSPLANSLPHFPPKFETLIETPAEEEEEESLDSFTTASIILSSLIALQFLSQTTARPIADHIPVCVTQFNLQKAVCNRSYDLDSNLCIETIRSNPKASTAVDVKALAKAVFKTAKEQSLNLN